MQLRTYQTEAIHDIMKSFKRGNTFTLLKAPTGAGKTVIMSELISSAVYEYKIKVLVMAHRGVLVDQTIKTLANYGLKAIDARKEKGRVEGEVVVSTIQTVAKREVGFFNMVIIDEAHRLARGEKDSQYNTVLKDLMAQNGRLRVLGLTATPFRLNDGLIYGHEGDWFKELAYDIELDDLIEQKYLVPMKYFMDKGADLSKIKKVAGEYNERELGEEMSRELHLESVAHAIELRASDRTHVAVFCVTIAHAELMAEKLGGLALHSKMTKNEREATLLLFKTEGGFLCSVGALQEGWDEPKCDCVVLARPTMSPALYVQMIGRGLRLSEGKNDCLILDMVACYNRHGSPNDPNVIEKGQKTEASEQVRRQEICFECGYLLNEDDNGVCPECGANVTEFNDRDDVTYLNKPRKMKEVNLDSDKVLISTVQAKDFYSRAGNYCIIVEYFIEDRAKPISQFYATKSVKATPLRKLNKALTKMYGTTYEEFGSDENVISYINNNKYVGSIKAKLKKEGNFYNLTF